MTPIKFKENRVWRVYRGGSGIDRLRGKVVAEDGLFPEDWIASTVRANNPVPSSPREGVSDVLWRGEMVSFPDFLAKEGKRVLGAKHAEKYGSAPGFLTKLLDSATRLPLQAHPGPEAARRLFHFPFGKNEAWIILSTRRVNDVAPYVLLGFNENLDKELFVREALSGRFSAGLGMLCRHEVQPGDTILVPAGTPHAIGPGVTMVEIMEPSDLVVQPEAELDGQPLAMSDRFGVCLPEQALSIFDWRTASTEKTRETFFPRPTPLATRSGAAVKKLIDRDAVGYFGALSLSLNGEFDDLSALEGTFAVGVVTDGTFDLTDNDATLTLRSGDAFLAPFERDRLVFSGKAEILFALPPPSAITGSPIDIPGKAIII